MGLAASQARLLTITARKADCEFQSMALSHEKIALSRDMEKISDEYQDAMNQTKLVYDYYGTGTSQMNLNYGLLMTPSVYNDYYPKLVTDNKNRVVLSGPFAEAAKIAGIPEEGYSGTASSEVRNKFIEALRDNGTISSTTAATIESVSYNNAVGLGATFSATAATQDVTYSELLDLIKANCADTKDYGLQLGGGVDVVSALDTSGVYPDTSLLTCAGVGQQAWLGLYNNSGNSDKVNTSESLGDVPVSLYNLLDSAYNNKSGDHYVMKITTGKGVALPWSEAAYMQQLIAGTENSKSFLNWMTEQFQSILGGVSENDQALQYAYDQVYDLIYPNEKLQDRATYLKNYTGSNKDKHEDNNTKDKQENGGRGYMYFDVRNDTKNSRKWHGADYIDKDDQSNHPTGERNATMQQELREVATDVAYKKHSGDAVPTTSKEAADYIGMTFDYEDDGCDRDSWHAVALDLTNLTEVFLTAYVEYLQGMSSKDGIKNSKYSYEKGQTLDGKNGTTKASLYNPTSDDVFKIAAPTDVDTGDDNLVAGFYDAMFNIICMHGWTKNENITDADYMQELMKSGAVYISSIDNDGNYYQSSYSTDTYISEVADTEGQAQAEAKYNAAKVKIENKENTIDTKMKNLDTEISSLTTEYDTMKNVISKSIEKAFKRYDA